MPEGLLSVPLWPMLLLTALSLSAGWGIRGNFGHELGAAIPGALAGMAVACMSGRPDWFARVPYFAMFGALGWAFGGSIAYMHTVGYTHSPHRPTVLYGFANLFLIGFLWAALGGAGTALPACLDSVQLASLFVPVIAVLIAWFLKDLVEDTFFKVEGDSRHRSPLYWYDTDWLAAVAAFLSALVVTGIRGRLDIATSLVLYLSGGWFVAFLLLVNVFKLRMNPPRGDNWAGAVGMVVALLVWCWQYDFPQVAFAALCTGFLGGIGFAFAQCLKLLYIKSGLRANWHSVMEQTHGLFHGLALAVAMAFLAASVPAREDVVRMPAWTWVFAVAFVLVGVTYFNHVKATGTWVEKVESLPKEFYGLPVSGYLRGPGRIGWFELIYLAIGAAIVIITTAHLRHPLPVVPDTLLGQGELMYLVFLWWVVVFNFERALVGFTPQRIVTEGTITFNAVICTVLMALGAQWVGIREAIAEPVSYIPWLSRTVLFGAAGALLVTLFGYWFKHLLYGTEHAPGAGLHIRFGPNATAIRDKPKPTERHP